MEKLHQTILLATILIVSLFQFKTVSSQGQLEEVFSYLAGSEKGPEKWGEIHKEWGACGKGNMQSPIDLSNKRVEVLPDLGKLNRSYKPSPASLVNRGHDIMLQWADGAGGIYVNGTKYFLKQFHWHSPSEHTFNGVRYALEGHMVHESIDKKRAVVGILYKFGRHDTFLLKLMHHIHAIIHKESKEEEIGVIDPKDIKLGSRKYYRYMGSLTIPPCTEGVVWTIIKKVRTVSREQVRLLKTVVRKEFAKNARPTQPTKARMVRLYRPSST